MFSAARTVVGGEKKPSNELETTRSGGVENRKIIIRSARAGPRARAHPAAPPFIRSIGPLGDDDDNNNNDNNIIIVKHQKPPPSAPFQGGSLCGRGQSYPRFSGFCRENRKIERRPPPYRFDFIGKAIEYRSIL